MTKRIEIREEIVQELLAGYEKPEDLLGKDGLFEQLKKALVERALGSRTEPPSGIREGRSKAGREQQPPKRE